MDILANAGRELVFARTFNAPRRLVWEAWTDPKHISKWWGPEGFSSSVERLDLRAGGEFVLNMVGPDGRTWPCRGIYREVTPPSRIILAGQVSDDHPCGGGLPPHSIITVTLSEERGRTTVTIHTLLETAADREAALAHGFRAGWFDTFERLEKHLMSLA
jgi:uncharacterized protein YndB with AHSA1/START domain